MRSRLSFWSKGRPVASRAKSIEGGRNKGNGWHKEFQPWTSHTANKPFPFFSNWHIPRETLVGWCGLLQEPPPISDPTPLHFPALLIRQVTTLRVLAMGQQRQSRASGTWNPRTLAPSNARPLKKGGISCSAEKRGGMCSDWKSIFPKQTCHSGFGLIQTNSRA